MATMCTAAGPIYRILGCTAASVVGIGLIVTIYSDIGRTLRQTRAKAIVEAIHISKQHTFCKQPTEVLKLIAGVGAADDCHSGAAVQHRSRVARDPTQPNLRQVHLLHSEVLDELDVEYGALGENITTRGLDILSFSPGTTLCIGCDVVLAITGLRNPCQQIEDYRPGLLSQLLRKRPDGTLERRAGVMAVVVRGGEVRPGDDIRVAHPSSRHAMNKQLHETPTVTTSLTLRNTPTAQFRL
eukprot:TRINITY_DN12077_c0_g2_i6.p2 TRINITY_DN12077_c0_g2~~TRINITY_DN12077_c0_g2_i6.p2  ORF type:complete len:241 (+),score=30.68 TRINITY_DN12077_c0_g2_i6:530-1252(+)